MATLFWCQLTSNFLKTHHGCMLTCGVVLQDGVLAERLVLPCNQNILEACRSGVITPKNHWSKQSRAALLLRNIDLDTHRDCKGMTNDCYTPTTATAFSIYKMGFGDLMCQWRQPTEFCKVKTTRVRRFLTTLEQISKWKNQKNWCHRQRHRKQLTVKLPTKYSEAGMKPVDFTFIGGKRTLWKKSLLL